MKSKNFSLQSAFSGLLIALVLLVSGCGWKKKAEIVKKPRPVEVALLTRDEVDPARRMIKGGVSSWRTETVAMEVGGRLTYLADENTIFVPSTDKPSETVNQLPSWNSEEIGSRSDQLLARIDDEKYRILKEKAEVAVLKTQASIKAAQVEEEKLLPAQEKAAVAARKLASREYERAKGLFAQDAFPEAELFRLEAEYENSVAAEEQVQASIVAQQANIDALQNQLLEDKKNLEDAKRNLNNCNLLFKSFRGELTKTEVEMGDLVQPNQVIGTVQMMDPIMIEFEVSSYDSRRLAKLEKLRVMVDEDRLDNDGKQVEPLLAKIYEIDAVADPSSRTFTVTLLMFNRRTGVSSNLETGLLVTEGLLPLDISIFADESEQRMHAPEECIFKDSRGSFVLRVDNFKKGQGLPQDNILEVSPVYVEVSPVRQLFYGDDYFREIRLPADTPDELKLDRENDLIAGPMLLPQDANPDQWDWATNNRVTLKDNRQWLLRPGELVDVDISSSVESEGEYNIPIDAISPEGDQYFIFLLAGDEKSVEKKEVEVVQPRTAQAKKEVASYIKIRPLSGDDFEGRKYVRRGAHYLIDNEAVRVVPSGESP